MAVKPPFLPFFMHAQCFSNSNQELSSKGVSGKAKGPRTKVTGRQMNLCLGETGSRSDLNSLNEEENHLNENSVPFSVYFERHCILVPLALDSDKEKE